MEGRLNATCRRSIEGRHVGDPWREDVMRRVGDPWREDLMRRVGDPSREGMQGIHGGKT